MAIFRCSLVLAALLQAPPPAPDSTVVLWARVRTDTTDANAWLQLGRAYLGRPVGNDTAGTRAALDTADLALMRAVRFGAGAVTDSARTFRLFAWGERALLASRRDGVEADAETWGHLPDDARLPPVLEELGENLLRACPDRGVLITARDSDTHAAAYLRFVRRLRPDLTVVPLDRWSGDVTRRPACASMAFERPPPGRRVHWQARPLVWVAGRTKGVRDRVPPEDFVFAALRIALDDSSSWVARPVEVYRRAVKEVPALCKGFKAFGITAEVGCRR